MNDTEAAFATGDRGKSLVITTAVFTVVALLFVIVRLYTRLKIIRNAGIDDVIIVVASVCVSCILARARPRTRSMILCKIFSHESQRDKEMIRLTLMVGTDSSTSSLCMPAYVTDFLSFFMEQLLIQNRSP